MLIDKYDLVLFDLDGTTIDTDELIVETFNELCRLYRNGKLTPKEQLYKYSGPPIAESLKKEFPDIDSKFIYDEFHRISVELYPKYIKIYEDLFDVLTLLKKKNIKLGVVTNKLHSTSEYCLNLTGLDKYFTSLVAINDVAKPKPDKAGIIKSMEYFHIKDRNKVIYIGDNASDYFTATNSGIDSIIMRLGPREFDKNLHPTYIFKNYKEFKEVMFHD